MILSLIMTGNKGKMKNELNEALIKDVNQVKNNMELIS